MPTGERVTLGDEIIEWIEAECRVPEGALVGQPLMLMGWQKDAIRFSRGMSRLATRNSPSFSR